MISTLGGLFNLNHFDQSSCANDVIVIRHKDGSLRSTPFNVRFGRAQMWSYVGRIVQVEVNGELTTAVMKIGKGGEAYWLQPTYGAFGDAGHGAATPKQSAKVEGGMPLAAAAVAGVLGPGHAVKVDGEELDSVGSLHGAVEEGETLAMDAAVLQHLPIRLESPPELPPPSAADGDDWGKHARAAAPRASSPLLELPRSLQGFAEGESASPYLIDCGHQRQPGGSHLRFHDAAPNLPLLHTAQDGHLTIEPRAIHSAGDAQEARLALRAMAAAEKSRKRLSKMSFGGDPYLRMTAQEEGHLDDDDADGASNAAPLGKEDAAGDGRDHLAENGPEVLAAEIVVDSADVTLPSNEAAVRVADDGQVVAEGPAEQGRVSSASLAPAPLSPPPPTEAAAAAASSATSVTGSTDSYKVADEDAYFLGPIGADYADYIALYGEEEAALLKGASFVSSVTSGVSLPDLAMQPGTTAGDSAAALCRSVSTSEGDICPAAEGNRASGTSASLLQASQSTGTASSSIPPPRLPSPTPQATGESLGSGSAREAGKAAAAHGSTGVSFTTAKSAAVSSAGLSASEEVVDAEGRPVKVVPGVGGSGGGPYFTRTLIPVEADLWKLHLREGCNTVRYLARKDKGDIVSISCNIFLWNWTDRLVVSDVDGTITKSDLLGHFYAMLGKGADWTHPGICNLYSKIERNGYRMVYLTARSLSQINQTKSYLFTLQQDGVRLPMGPVLTAPQRFFTALTREVSKQSHVFKIACLAGVRAAFPPSTKPFFAGFGNRYNDVISYDAAGIPTHKIFIIDPSSVLHVCLVRQTYRDLGHLVDVTFPPVKRHPVLLRVPRRLQRVHSTGVTASPAKAAAAAAGDADRHAYARCLLHRSASASSSSAASSISSMASSVSDFSEQREWASGGSSDLGVGSAAAASSHDGRRLVKHRGHDAAYQASEPETPKDDGARVSRHASAAFSLVDSVRVDIVATKPLSSSAASPGESRALVKDGSPTTTALEAGVLARLPAPLSTVVSFPATAKGPLPTAKRSGASLTATGSLAVQPSTSATSVHSLKYSYGSHLTFSELKDDADDAPHEEDETPVDPEFSSYVYWRMNPHDLITVPATTATSSAAAGATRANAKGAEKGKAAAVSNVPHTPKVARISAAATYSAEQNDGATLTAATVASASGPAEKGAAASDAASASGAPLIRGTASAAPLLTAAATKPSGAVEAVARRPVRGRSRSSLAVPGRGNASPMRGSADSLESRDLGCATSAAAVAGLTSPGTRAEVHGPPPRTPERVGETHTAEISPYDDWEVVVEASADAGGPPFRDAQVPQPTSGGSGIGVFFSAFTFGRSRAIESPLSPTSQRAAQSRADVKQRALWHPDARDYYATQQQQQQPSTQPPPSLPGAGASATTKAGTPHVPHR
ncbi:hypothetical protein LSCM1_07991 [Leishmania martiniquensis]|uniref:LNS2/PITP domain-containing protein n=1 Tax=Leishmania martiniquensis TaxID=1580590 RepID=A0A836HIB1_9TRYP|nr:hypothetical protein LSCM1_07991 [Leishmania martiniquensis]